MRRWPVPFAAVLLVAAITGCGVPDEPDPRPVTPPRGPFQALVSPTPAVTASGPVTERLCLVRDGALVTVTRHIAAQPTVQRLIADLLAGPTDDEQASGLSSALLGGDLVAGIQVRGSRAVVDLTAAIEGAARSDEVLAYAQLVCTLTGRDDISDVVFTRAGNPIAVPTGDGSLSTGPLTLADYRGLVASRSPSPSVGTSTGG
jgi:hypothetical protein